MQAAQVLSVLLYMLSAAAYLAFFFLQRKALERAGFFLILAGFLCQTAAIAADFVRQGHLPASNLRETLAFAGWTVAGAFLVLHVRYRLKVLGLVAAPFVTLITVVAAQLPDSPAEAAALFKSFWLIAHVTVIFVGESAFALAAGVGGLYLLQEGSIKFKKRRFLLKRLPSLDLLDSAGYACIVIGFTMMTLGLISGFVYAKAVWGRFWSWDPKEVWSGITWLFYAVLLHERLAVGWRGRKSAIMAIVGFAFLVFTFLGVNLLLEGHHQEFTR